MATHRLSHFRGYANVDDIPVPYGEEGNVPLARLLEKSYTDAFLVLHKGHIVTEQYFNGMTQSSPHHLWSASKSISVGVVFNLLANGTLQANELVTNHCPELKESGYQGATIRHLMDMQSGVKYEYGDLKLAYSDSEGGRHFRAAGLFPKLPGEDPLEGQCSFFPKLKKAREHGSMFYYKCVDTAVLGWVCERASKRRFADLVSDYIWSKLGAEQDAVYHL